VTSAFCLQTNLLRKYHLSISLRLRNESLRDNTHLFFWNEVLSLFQPPSVEGACLALYFQSYMCNPWIASKNRWLIGATWHLYLHGQEEYIGLVWIRIPFVTHCLSSSLLSAPDIPPQLALALLGKFEWPDSHNELYRHRTLPPSFLGVSSQLHIRKEQQP